MNATKSQQLEKDKRRNVIKLSKQSSKIVKNIESQKMSLARTTNLMATDLNLVNQK